MFGDRRRTSLGQLALMDAAVFFVIAMTISCVLVYYARREVTRPSEDIRDGGADPGAILHAFLRSSMGREIVLHLDKEVRISGTSEIVECIKSELDALIKGADIDDFKPMNDELIHILEGISGPFFDPFLVAAVLSDSGYQELFSLPGTPSDNVSRDAASIEFPGFDGSTFLLMLILVPAFLPEFVDIAAGKLDLRPGIGHAPSDLHPRYDEHHD